MGFAVVASILLFGVSDPRVLTLQFDHNQSWPKDLTVLRGTVLRLEGKADSGNPTNFVVRDNGRLVGSTTTGLGWTIDWNTQGAPAGPSVLEVAFRLAGQDEILMAHIDLQVLDRSPYAFETAGVASNGDPIIRQMAGAKDTVKSVAADLAGASVPAKLQGDGTYRIPISGRTPGPHQTSLLVTTRSGAVFDSGTVVVTVPEKVAFDDPKPLRIERTAESDGSAVRLGCLFPDGLSTTNVDVDLKPGGVFIPKAKGGQVLLVMDALPEGTRMVSLQATGPDGTVYVSRPREITVHSNPSYVTLRALQSCQALLEDCAQYFQGVVAQASAIDIGVRIKGASGNPAEAWDQVGQEIADAIVGAQAPEPEGLAQADTAKIVPGLNHVNGNWLLYGALLSKAMADSWGALDGADFARFSADVRSRKRSLESADQAVRDAAEARRNLVGAFTRLAGDLPLDRLKIADSFALDSSLLSWMKRRACLLKLFADASESVNGASPLGSDEMRARARLIRLMTPDLAFSDEATQLIGLAMEQWGLAVEDGARIKDYQAQKDRILGTYGGDATLASAADSQILAQCDQVMTACAEQKAKRLKAGLTLAGQVLERERVAVIQSGS